METKDLLKKVRKIEIKTRRLSNNIFGGEYHSAFKGRGMTFSEVRNYQFGDDVRAIDWNVTARYNEPFVKVFEEERELTLMLLVDVSGSKLFGTDNVLKKNIVTEISATLAFSNPAITTISPASPISIGTFFVPSYLKILVNLPSSTFSPLRFIAFIGWLAFAVP